MSAGSALSSRQAGTSQLASQREEAERLRMLLKLFSMYPPRPDAEMTTAAYMEELRDVPSLVLSHALHRLVRKPGEFAPNVAAIRREAALYVREQHRRASGQEESSPIEMDAELAERWLQRAADPLPALPAGSKPLELPAPAAERDRAIAILDAEIARLERGMRVPR